MTHPIYGDGKITQVFRCKKELRVHAELENFHWVETPRDEWKLKR